MSKRSRRLVVSIMAPEGHGKTHMLLTMPMPMILCGMDPNTEAVIEQMFGVDDVDDLDPAELKYVRVPYPLVGFEPNEDDIMKEATESWYQIKDEVSAVKNGKAKIKPASFLFDSGTLLDRMNILREFGRTDRISPIVRRNKMGALNNDFKGLFDALEFAGVHVGITHRVREVWETVTVRTNKGPIEKDQVVPGEYRALQFKEMGYLANVEVLMMFDPKREGKLSERFGMRVTRSRQRPGVIGEEYWGKVEGQSVCSVPYLGTLLYPGTTPEDWA